MSNYNNVWLVGLSLIAVVDQTFSETVHNIIIIMLKRPKADLHISTACTTV